MVSNKNKAFINVIIDANGYLEIYDQIGQKIIMPKMIVRLTQKAGEIDKILIQSPVNSFSSVDEMKKFIIGGRTQ